MRVIIMSGLPGAGKSKYIVDRVALAPGGEGHAVVSADHYQVNDAGEYEFRPERIAEAHRRCKEVYLSVLTGPHPPAEFTLFVDNTNTSPEEIGYYYDLAEVVGVPVEIVRIHVSPETAICRNIHRVPIGTIMGMHANLISKPLPTRWRSTHILGE